MQVCQALLVLHMFFTVKLLSHETCLELLLKKVRGSNNRISVLAIIQHDVQNAYSCIHSMYHVQTNEADQGIQRSQSLEAANCFVHEKIM